MLFSQNTGPGSLHHPPLRGEELFISSKQQFFKNLFPPAAERGKLEETMIQNSIRKHEDTWDSRLFIFYMIFSFFKCDNFTFL